MPREQSPAFQFYPQDFLSDANVLAMNSEERGVYIVLICHCWLHGFVPNDQKALRRLGLYEGNNWPRAWRQISGCFKMGSEGLINPRVERERQKQADYRAMKARAGQAGGKQRASRHQAATQAEGVAESSPPSSSSSSSPYSRIDQQAKERDLLSSTSKNGSSSQAEKDHATRLAAARAMDRPWQKEQRRGVHRQR